MTKTLFFLTLSVVALLEKAGAQNGQDPLFKKAADGSEYKLFRSGNGIKVPKGFFLELNSIAAYKDSVLFSTYDDAMPQYALYDTADFPPPFKEIFADINAGDSVVLRLSCDSLIARGQSAPFMEKGTFIYQVYKITACFAQREQADSAQKSHLPLAKKNAFKKQLTLIENSLQDNKERIELDNKKIEDYLAKNKMHAVKGKWGAYVVIKQEGTGKQITYDDTAYVNYSGRVLGSIKVFDSNTDPKFQHVEPYAVNLAELGAIIPGWTDGLLQMKNGTVATVYIPSTLGYGVNGRAPEIAPDAILVFNMSIVKVNSSMYKKKTIPVKKAVIQKGSKKGK